MGEPDVVPGIGAEACEWVCYDLQVRRRYPISWGADATPAVRAPHSVAEKAVALCHGDGRIRQRALQRQVPERLLPLVVLRCADWAGPVRDAARHVLAAIPPRRLAETADMILRLAGRRHGSFAHELLQRHLRAGERGTREGILHHRAYRVRRWAYQQAADRQWLSAEELAHTALSDPDVLVQHLCATAVLALPEPAPALHEQLLAARAARVRAAAVTALHRTGRHTLAEPLLTDRAALVRSCAQWVLRRAGSEPACFYRARLTQGEPVQPGVVWGLGECGSTPDAALITPFLAHPRPKVRAAAVSALHHLHAADPARLAQLLADPSAAVARCVAAVLQAAEHLPAPDTLRAHLASDRPAHTRRAAMRLLAAGHSSGIEGLRTALPLVDDPDPAVRTRARTLVTRWSPPDAAKLCAALPAAERDRLAHEIDKVTPILGPGTGRLLRWMLGL